MKRIHAFDRGIYNPYKMENVKIKSTQTIKEKKILFTEDYFNEEEPRKWEVRYDNGYPTVFYDPSIEKYRCYYSTFISDESSSQVSLAERRTKEYQPTIERLVALCYAESNDGINWEKPNLNITEWKGSKKIILSIFLHGSSVMLDENENNPAKRYKMFTKIDYGNGIHYLAVAFSADGIRFEEYIPLKDFNPRADTYNYVYYEETTKNYILMTRTWRDSMRVPIVSYSKDFINWSESSEIMSSPSFENQIYSMPFFKKDNYYIGLASVYHEGDRLADNFDQVDLHLTYSYDKKNWYYIDLETPFIERGKRDYQEGEFDNGCIFSATPIEIDGREYFYYLGGNGPHTNYRETSLARAYLLKERYAYLQVKNKEVEAAVYTNGFIFLGNQLTIDAEIEQSGYVKVNLYSNNHEPVEHSEIIFTETNQELICKIPDHLFREIIRLEIRFKDAKIYSFQGKFDTFRIENDNSLLRA